MPSHSSLRPSEPPRESMRRRSGGYSAGNGTSQQSSVRLVASHSPSSDRNLLEHDYAEDENVSFNPVIFTPRPTSRSNYLPSSHEYPSSTRSIPPQSRGSSLLSFPQVATSLLPVSISSGLAYLTSRRPSLSARSDSDRTLYLSRSNSNASETSVDSGHKKLIPSIRTTDKFTNKWPRPQSLKVPKVNRSGPRWENRKGIRIIRETVSELEDGYGLGFDQIDRWTGFKWCLMISVVSVLCYGSAAMICAILTCFRSTS